MKFVKICLLFFIVACTCAESLKELNKKMVCAVNKEREKYGLPYLALSDNLIQAAQRHSEYQYKNKRVTHDENIKGYEKSWDRIKQSGFKNQAYTGENVAGGYKTIEEVMKGWMKSKGHRENILNENFTYFGAGNQGNYWTQDFASSKTGKPKNVKKCP